MTCFTSRLLTFSVTKPDPCLFLCLQINRNPFSFLGVAECPGRPRRYIQGVLLLMVLVSRMDSTENNGHVVFALNVPSNSLD